jgi:hypothetical protein
MRAREHFGSAEGRSVCMADDLRCRNFSSTALASFLSHNAGLNALMLRMSSLSIGVAACCGLTIVGGCTRTSDGSVVLARPLISMPFLRPGLGSATPSEPVGEFSATEFPPPQPSLPETKPVPPPEKAAARVVPDIQLFKPSIKPPFARSDPSRLPSCRNEPSPTGRIRVVCQ